LFEASVEFACELMACSSPADHFFSIAVVASSVAPVRVTSCAGPEITPPRTSSTKYLENR
jgi:hypothetical protein